ncbi:MAG: helix-turn-helix transcriptional regulator [Anaerolineales bacterium]
MDYQLAINILSKKMGVLLRTARTQRGESKKACGEIIGSTARTISKYEAGDKSPSLPELEVLAPSLVNSQVASIIARACISVISG